MSSSDAIGEEGSEVGSDKEAILTSRIVNVSCPGNFAHKSKRQKVIGPQGNFAAEMVIFITAP